jgi:hypothetical protein
MTKKSSVQEFADTIKDNPKKIIAWANREIKEYQKLIKILEKYESSSKRRVHK